MWRVVVCDQESSYAMRLYPARGLQNTNPQWVVASVEKKHVMPTPCFEVHTNDYNFFVNVSNRGLSKWGMGYRAAAPPPLSQIEKQQTQGL